MRALFRARDGRWPRVWIAWGAGWAVQAYWYLWAISFGVHLDLRRPLLDLHVLWFTISIGRAAHISRQEDRHRHTCRGFLFATDPEL
jgi:hypothetical protein